MKKLLLIILGMLFITTSLSSQTFTCGDTLLDVRDGKKYTTVLIGSQCWMKQSLNFGKTVNSYTSTVIHPDMFNNSIYEKYAYNNDSTKLSTYGALYEWDELMNYTTVAGGQGLCPANWHVPTDAEWQTMIVAAGGTLITSAGGYGGNKLKAIGEGFGLGVGTNSSGFSAKHSGDRDSYGIFYGLTARSIFWTSTQNTGASAYQFTLWADRDTIAHGGNAQKITGFACRCLRNASAGIEESNLNNQFNLYPNPTQSIVNITTSDFRGEMKFIVKDLAGRNILNTTSKQIDISDLQSGLYLLQILNAKTEELLGVKKIIKD